MTSKQMQRKPTESQRFTLRGPRRHVEAALEPPRESWWLKFATGERDPNFTAAVEMRFANREPEGPILHDWTAP